LNANIRKRLIYRIHVYLFVSFDVFVIRVVNLFNYVRSERMKKRGPEVVAQEG
jgi:hypothetical protein